MIHLFSRLEPGVVAIGAAVGLVWLLVLQVLFIVLWVKYRRLFRGENAHDLEDVIVAHGDKIEAIRKREIETKDALGRIRHHLERAISHVHVVRFNPFGAGVAEQSFSVALLDDTASGVVVSCLQSGDGSSRVYGKPIEQRNSTHRLSPEEEKAIAEAMKTK
ncbi:DUF4446 family protein [Candidatus Fermentibacteria bacterium]|nr:DUF4446 family protein [Candidatus Fermentibacteria bacterium]